MNGFQPRGDGGGELSALDLEEQVLDVFVQALRIRHGYDFSGYARASLKRRVRQLASDLEVARIGDLIPRLLYEPALCDTIIEHLSVPVSDLFRDPWVFASLREKVMPVLASWPRINVWQAGCAYGEEVFSLAIMLFECGLARRSQIYATDINDHALEKAAEGIFGVERLADFESNYRAAGGTAALSDYYHARYALLRMRRELGERVTFAHHNLVTDGVFAEAHMILCRNVLIYFSQPLKDRVVKLFADSLVHGGFLVLGDKETLQFSRYADCFSPVDEQARIYRLRRRAHA
ncbi:protein-glutamate O-methyltransferase CheR [Salinisphaera sp. Q1T1-3]|uniref:CheR family methyltransferase n=1 Tax=Salinisphaera sp. Q1T1-3 TaxID=2321229 RepID=UPI000E772853|nr:CheR family methyltransferase [Salinisphaera sp. Q1T1-3]RJS95009.1 protein-glutamate O-methyltransferase CheR [Salinisphaera sp. Q1T1-3]